ncbi:PEP/pyruvate-binding domain-containing protein [Polaromonas sp.]|uniref:PEP/pyruvate-binding domain-containing protein n=1 Tax=Polaromonas sp. TaxID=1869339 RepID=UPI00248A3D31|nr:PEP/pyruvate-binding domain-containing protein [Polaromonas sp.]MDI1341492.1 PEP/pyruvate-binding domain-containing protein [Polaromonas sp.]
MSSTSLWPKHLYLIAEGNTQPQHKPSRESMGSKAYHLLRMKNMGLPVPPALVIGTHYAKSPEDCMLPVFTIGLPALQEAAGRILGDMRNPLIVSIRSGAPVSMPGMMETLLNIGLCDQTLPGLLRQTGNPRLVWDAYRRLIASYGEVVAGLPGSLFEDEIDRVTEGRDERQMNFAELRSLTRQFLALYQLHAGHPFPQDVNEQLSGAIRGVFMSWHAEKAQAYREINQIDHAMGTAVTIQSMVFGNSGGHSGAGVGFTRNPTTGERQPWVDFLANAQGEDVVSGRRNAHGHKALASVAPDAWRKLQEAAQTLEREFSDMQDFEFTVQDGVLYMLQTRSGKRTPLAAARIALDLLDEGLIDAATALERTSELHETDLGTVQLASQGNPQAQANPLGQAMSACSGVVSGEIILDGARAAASAAEGASLVLVRQDAETSDIATLEFSVGLLTQRGARTSHAAVVARQLGKVCLVGCETLRIDLKERTVRLGDQLFKEGDVITLDGNDGRLYAGVVAAVLVPDAALIERLRALRTAQTPTRHQKHTAS